MSLRPPRDAEQEKALLRARLARLRSLRAALASPTSLASQAVAAYGWLVDEAIEGAAAGAHRAAFGCGGGQVRFVGRAEERGGNAARAHTNTLSTLSSSLPSLQAPPPDASPPTATTPSTASPTGAGGTTGTTRPPLPPRPGVANRECLPPPPPPLPPGVVAAATSAVAARVDAFGAPIGRGVDGPGTASGGGGGGGGGGPSGSGAGDVACPRCARRVAVSRFAPHLEKCLGGGRAAGRAATRRSYAA